MSNPHRIASPSILKPIPTSVTIVPLEQRATWCRRPTEWDEKTGEKR